MLKNNTAFWQCWRSKFERSNKCSQVDGSVDSEVITNKFADHFRASITCNNPDKAELLKQSYFDLRATYCGLPATDTNKIDTELVSRTITNLKRGKAMDIDGLTAEHVQLSSSFTCDIKIFFYLMINSSFVPDGFRYSYIVPVPKPKEHYSKSLTCDDLRAVAISPILSEVGYLNIA